MMMLDKSSRGSRRRVVISLVVILAFVFTLPAAAHPKSPFCADASCAPTRKTLKSLLDFIVKEKSTYPTIYIGGYYMRDLVAGYEIFGNRHYLDTAIAYGDHLLKRQMPNGFWATGYGPVYLADTGSALGLFIDLYRHVDRARRKKYFTAVKRYTDALQKGGMIRPNGAIGEGWRRHKKGKLISPIYDQYTISSALTGAEIFTWMYHKTKNNRYRKIAHRALQWIFSTMRGDGNIAHIDPIEGAAWSNRGDPKTDFSLWIKRTYGTAAYVGEGVIAFDLYCDKPAWKSWIEKAVRPNIEFLLREQLVDGTWSKQGRKSWDRTRSPGIINYLIWYYQHVDRDPRIAKAVKRYDAYIVVPKNAKYYGLLSAGAHYNAKDYGNPFNTVTSLAGRALAGILSPGVTALW